MPTVRDGHDDFNFLMGRWRTKYRMLRKPLAHDDNWDQCDGNAVVTPFWDSHGNLEIGDIDCPPPRGHIESMTLRIYSDDSHQWSLYWGTKKVGLAMPPQVGHFDDQGVGEFFAPDTFNEKPIIVRYRWSTLNGLPHFEQAFSADDGVTWETNWICDYDRS